MAYFVAEVIDPMRIRDYFSLCEIPRGSGRQDDYVRAKAVLVGLQRRGYVFDFGEAMRQAADWVRV